MPVKVQDDVQEVAVKEFSVVEQLIRDNGGSLTPDIDNSKLTHLVLFKKDLCRRVELMRRTEK